MTRRCTSVFVVQKVPKTGRVTGRDGVEESSCSSSCPAVMTIPHVLVLQEEASASREADCIAPSPVLQRSLWCMNVPLPAVGRSRGASGAGGQGGSSFLLHRFRPHLSNMRKKNIYVQEKLQLTASVTLPKPGGFWSFSCWPSSFSQLESNKQKTLPFSEKSDTVLKTYTHKLASSD